MREIIRQIKLKGFNRMNVYRPNPVCVVANVRPYCSRFAVPMRKDITITVPIAIRESLIYHPGNGIIEAVDDSNISQGLIMLSFDPKKNRLEIDRLRTATWSNFYDRYGYEHMRLTPENRYDEERALKRIGSVLMATVVQEALKIRQTAAGNFPLLWLKSDDQPREFYNKIGMRMTGFDRDWKAIFVFDMDKALEFHERIVAQYGIICATALT